MNYKTLVIAFGLTAIVSKTFAATEATAPVISESRVTLGLEMEYQTPGLDARDGSGNALRAPRVVTNNWSFDKSNAAKKFTDITQITESRQDGVRTRYGNKELLLDLQSQGVITSIVGWYISMYSDALGHPYALYLSNTTTGAHIRLNSTYITFATATAPNTTERFYFYHATRDYVSTAATTHDYTTNGYKNLTCQYPFGFTTTKFTTTAGGRISFYITEKALGNTATPFYVPTGGNTTAVILAGTRSIVNEQGATVSVPVLVDGSISISGGVTLAALPTGVTGS